MKRHSRLQTLLLPLVLGLGCCAMAAGWVVWATHSLVSTLHPVRQAVTPADTTSAQAVLGTFETVAFRTVDGLTLRGWYKPSTNGAVVIFVHGGGANRTWFLPEAQELVTRGMGVLLYDSRACGESDGDLQSWGDHEQNDVAAAITYLTTRPDVDPQRVGIEGFSMGSTTATLAAAGDPRVHAVVLNALWTSLEDEITDKAGFPKMLTTWWVRHQFAQAGVRVDQVRPIDQIGRIAPRELLMVEAEHDLDTPMRVTHASYAATRGPKKLWVIPGADHTTYFTRGGGTYLRQVGDFFSKHL